MPKENIVDDLLEAKMVHGYKVDIDSYCDHSESEGTEYGSWEESYTNTLRSVKPVSDNSDLLSKHELKDGDTAFVVWVEYSHGNSFGTSTRGSVLAIGLFRDVAAAQELVKSIKEVGKNDVNTSYGDKFKMDCKTSDGQVFKMGWCPWHGYFEHLDEVHIDVVTIGEEK